MNYKNAFNCKKCPQTNTENGCPCWLEVAEQNTQTGEQRIQKLCVFAYFPVLMIELIKASNRPAAEISAMRVEFVNGFQNIGEGLQRAILALPMAKTLEDKNAPSGH